ncbi:tRNA lysidine(34) synthetase TilS [Corynebacterium felinum]|uniref:tRNA(Ile)-lysidine synthase n=1 Tax=Corynebacterium felinum TaxID=131318 RepID=A0ABU2B5G0_9CORY|nr:tRNA lysidine(34) synthetase TilS [Corynebacterium felinum]MDF5820110.1 tRNA lysidine(34) synthetase TilS [Corynebacterium felinum]MDR7353855.1 tRNA(Ile)-lysidine synthase [Corynebacterium felinum]WJY96030.1 tRNA(Ile)-lysidine synthase [Corynebacterium felinum]
MTTPFWPDSSPHFLRCRHAVRGFADERAVVGLSGGADSLALVAAAAAEGIDIVAVCIDHGLQPHSATIAQQAAEQARKLGVPAEVIPVQVAAGNVEAQARHARYKALFSRADKEGRRVWVAHTANDQAETVLLSALRGHISPMRVNDQVTRPFLHITRTDTEQACRELGLDYWDDPMNADPAFRRVRIRTELIPLLADIAGYDVIPVLAQAGHTNAEEQQALDCYAEASVDVDTLAAMPKAVRTRSIHALLRENKAKVNAQILGQVEQLITNWRGQGAVDAGAWRVRRIGKVIVLESKNVETKG